MFTYTVTPMKRLFFSAGLFLLSFALLFPGQKGPDRDQKDWLDLVQPIITEVEREVFLKLESREERTKFINMFWARRDPLPDTKDNEFYREYMERVRYADFNFGRGAVKKGSQTDRGFFYLLLGPPLERQSYATYSQVWPLEVWHYKGDPRYGLPPYFYLIFFQIDGMGEYKLYSPGVDGPEKLVIPSMSNQTLTRRVALQTLKDVSGEVYSASLSYIPGDSSAGSTSSMSSDLMIASLRELPNKKYSDAYARTFSYYKDYVETDYSHNFLESYFLLKLFTQGDQPFLHWSIEPSRINLSHYQDKFYAEFLLVMNIQDPSGRPVYEMEETIPISVNEKDSGSLARQMIAFQDIFPITPGRYNIHFFLQNKTAKEFTSFETKLDVPDNSASHLSDLLLFNLSQDIDDSQQARVKAFSFAGKQYVFNAQETFHPQQELGIFCQIEKIPVQDTRADVNIVNLDTGDSALHLSKPLAEVLTADGGAVDFSPIPLKDLKAGYYRVDLNFINASGEAFAGQKDNFVLTALSRPTLPRVLSKLHPPFPNPGQQYILASQLFAKQEYEAAADLLSSLLARQDTAGARVLLGRTQFALSRFEAAIATVLPQYEKTGDSESGKIIAASYAALRDWASALEYLEPLLARASEVAVLNQAAECYIHLDKPEKALPLLEKSLELNSNQPAIKELVEKQLKTIKK